jgi:outer membrane protein
MVFDSLWPTSIEGAMETLPLTNFSKKPAWTAISVGRIVTAFLISSMACAAAEGESAAITPNPTEILLVPKTPATPVTPMTPVTPRFGAEDVASFAVAPKRRTVLASDAIAIALRNNLDLQVKAVGVDIEAARLRTARGGFDPVFELDLRYDSINTPQNSQQFVATGGLQRQFDPKNNEPFVFEEDNYHLRASLAGRWATGTKYELFTLTDRLVNTLNIDPTVSLFTPEYFTQSGVTLTQPVLRDFGTDVNLSEVRVARKNKLISELELQASALAMVSEVMRTFYDLAFSSEQENFRREEITVASRMLNDKRTGLERGVESSREYARAEIAVSESVEKLVLTENIRIEHEISLMRLLAEDQEVGLGHQLTPLPRYVYNKVRYDSQALLAEALKNRPDYLAARQKVERENIKLVFAKNQTLPRLDVKGTVAVNGLGDSVGQSMSRAYSGDNPQYSIGILLSIPFGNREALGKRDEALAQKQQAVATLKQVENTVVLDINRSLEVIEVNYRRLEAMRKLRDHVSSAFDEEKARLEKGLATEIDVLKFHRDYTEARTRALAALADYNKAIVALYTATGTLLQRENVVFEKEWATGRRSASDK